MAKNFFKFVFVSSILSGMVGANSIACLSTDFPLEIGVSSIVEKCDEYVGLSSDDYFDPKSFGVSTKVRPVYNSKFELFNDFDFVKKRSATYNCEQTANLYTGIKQKKEQRVCHIAWEPDRSFSYKVRKQHFKNYKITSYLYEEVTGKFGKTEMVKREFCHNSGERVLTHIWVQGPYFEMKDVESGFKKMADQVLYPVQHIRIEQKTCSL